MLKPPEPLDDETLEEMYGHIKTYKTRETSDGLLTLYGWDTEDGDPGTNYIRPMIQLIELGYDIQGPDEEPYSEIWTNGRDAFTWKGYASYDESIFWIRHATLPNKAMADRYRDDPGTRPGYKIHYDFYYDEDGNGRVPQD